MHDEITRDGVDFDVKRPLLRILAVQLEMIGKNMLSIAPGALLAWFIFLALDAIEDLNTHHFGKLDAAALSVVITSLAIEFTNMWFYSFQMRGFVGVLIHAITSTPVIVVIEIWTILLFSALCRSWVRVGSIIGFFIGTWIGTSIWSHIFAKRKLPAQVLEASTKASGSSFRGGNQDLSFGSFLIMTGAISIAIAIINFIPMAVIQLSLSSKVVLIISNLLLPACQVLALTMVKSIRTSETEWAIRMFFLLALQFPTKFLRFHMDIDVQHGYFWFSTISQIILERLTPRLINLAIYLWERRTLQQTVSPTEDVNSISGTVNGSICLIATTESNGTLIGTSSDALKAAGATRIHASHSTTISLPAQSPTVIEDEFCAKYTLTSATGMIQLPTITTSPTTMVQREVLEPHFPTDMDKSLIPYLSPNTISPTRSSVHSLLPSVQFTKATTVILNAVVKVSNLYSFSRNDLAFSSYLSTLSALVCVLLPYPFDITTSALAHGLVHHHAGEAVDKAEMRLKTEMGWLGALFIVLEVMLETVLVKIETRYGIPIGMAPIYGWKEVATFNGRMIMNFMCAYAAIRHLFDKL